ncbi:MAG TPA: D-cysteine desulfhydrase family protein [Candidatus Dormibacteraeota bacterium]|nr:D-cysteine desulfhydrase family protein [Candidatus Dormibacteraeota bacterium]
MQVAHLPRYRLAPLPTPLEEAPRLRLALGDGSPRIFVKRDDLTGLAMGGNKVRKLEYHLGDALAQGCDVLVTTGAIQSNHCRITAAAARRAGLDAVLVLCPGESEEVQGNLLLDRVLGARVRIAPDPTSSAVEATAAEELDALRRAGRRPYLIAKGASTPLGAAAYAEAFMEVLAQTDALGVPVDAIVFCTGSGGTQAGLLGGARLLRSGVEIVGVGDGATRAELAPVVTALVAGMGERCGVAISIGPNDVVVLEDYGGTYGVPTPACIDAIRLAARTEGLILDPVYTGKAMAGLVDLARRGRWTAAQTVVFWHTGGQPALFALAEAVGAPE